MAFQHLSKQDALANSQIWYFVINEKYVPNYLKPCVFIIISKVITWYITWNLPSTWLWAWNRGPLTCM